MSSESSDDRPFRRHRAGAWIFVYGTLQTGEIRQSLWPCQAQQIVPAVACGRLFDLGPYPALVPGGDFVLGECRLIAGADLPSTLEQLDQIEGYQPGRSCGPYVRSRITWRHWHRLAPWAVGSVGGWAYAYLDARPETIATRGRYLRPAPGQPPVAHWRRAVSASFPG